METEGNVMKDPNIWKLTDLLKSVKRKTDGTRVTTAGSDKHMAAKGCRKTTWLSVDPASFPRGVEGSHRQG